MKIETYKYTLPDVLYGSLILREDHRLELLKNILCALESKRTEIARSYKNLQREEADWVLRRPLLSRSHDTELNGRGVQFG